MNLSNATKLETRTHCFTIQLARCICLFYSNNFFFVLLTCRTPFPISYFSTTQNIYKFKCSVICYLLTSWILFLHCPFPHFFSFSFTLWKKKLTWNLLTIKSWYWWRQALNLGLLYLFGQILFGVANRFICIICKFIKYLIYLLTLITYLWEKKWRI